MSRTNFSIAKVDNGYELQHSWRNEVFKTLDEVFTAMLLYCEGRGESFGGNSYGKVVIQREWLGGKSDGNQQ